MKRYQENNFIKIWLSLLVFNTDYLKMDFLMKFTRESNYHKEPQWVRLDMIFLHQYILYWSQVRQLRFQLELDVGLNLDGS